VQFPPPPPKYQKRSPERVAFFGFWLLQGMNTRSGKITRERSDGGPFYLRGGEGKARTVDKPMDVLVIVNHAGMDALKDGLLRFN
jgi:hypothetical protein